MPNGVATLLQRNKEKNSMQASRLKIVKTHFDGGLFVDTGSKLLPYAIALARDTAKRDLGHLFELFKVEIVPALFG